GGAPHEAEQALGTALPYLIPGAKSRGAVLLTEALQEQARWEDSLCVLEAHADSLIGDDAAYARVLRVLATVKLDRVSNAERAEAIEELCQTAKHAPHVDLRIRAIAAATSLSAGERDEHLAHRLYNVAADIPAESLEPEALVRLQGSKAVLAYEMGDLRASRRHLDEALHHAERHAIAGGLALRLRMGLAGHVMVAGAYDEAVRLFLQIVPLAEQLGNEDSRALVIANSIVCYGRLGRFTEMMRHAESLLASPRLPQRYARFGTCYWKGIGHALMGQRREALETLSIADKYLSENPSQIVRLWTLMKSDVLFLLGYEEQAKSAARRVIHYETGQPPIAHYEGLVARWTALAACRRSERLIAQQHLAELRARLERYAAIDQVEILGSIIYNQHCLGLAAPAEGAMMRDRLRHLPPATADLLAKLLRGPNGPCLPCASDLVS
ncbi:MAG: hypothetical protein C4345_08155, partial [Chloroflexota bacterium]